MSLNRRSIFIEEDKFKEQIDIPKDPYLNPMWTQEIISRAFKSEDLEKIFIQFKLV